MALAPYPSAPGDRSQWILNLRGPRNDVVAEKPYAFFAEQERTPSGEIALAATIFLTNRECPWRCVMCDLWRNTTSHLVPPRAIPGQISYALQRLPQARTLKLYNSGSFFDPSAIPKCDLPPIAKQCAVFDRLIVECHPRLVGRSALDFSRQINCRLEIAMGLETAHPTALKKLNKRITLADFERGAHFCKTHGMDVRAFILVNPPFIPQAEQEFWLKTSIETAFELGSDIVSLIPVRSGNGALDELYRQEQFHEPSLCDLEEALRYGLSLAAGNVFADTWELERFSECPSCFSSRLRRLQRMNLSQSFEPKVQCSKCQE